MPSPAPSHGIFPDIHFHSQPQGPCSPACASETGLGTALVSPVPCHFRSYLMSNHSSNHLLQSPPRGSTYPQMPVSSDTTRPAFNRSWQCPQGPALTHSTASPPSGSSADRSTPAPLPLLARPRQPPASPAPARPLLPLCPGCFLGVTWHHTDRPPAVPGQ